MVGAIRRVYIVEFMAKIKKSGSTPRRSIAITGIDVLVGKAVKNRRKRAGLTLTELSRNSGVSAAMISRIENGQSSASLASLNQIATALSVPVISLFEHTLQSTDINFVRASEGLPTIRVTPEQSHFYKILGKHNNSSMSFSASHVTLVKSDTVKFPVYQGEGFIFIQAQKGSAHYRCGDQLLRLRKGDTLSFDARLSNGIESLISDEFSFLSVFAKLL